jgi:hypothetical protein
MQGVQIFHHASTGGFLLLPLEYRKFNTIHRPNQCCASGSGSEIICKLGSGSVINSGSDSGSGFESGSKLSSASN